MIRKRWVNAILAGLLVPGSLPGTASAELRQVRQAFFGDECAPCARAVEQRVAEMAGVERVIVDPVRQLMTVELAPDNRVTPDRLEQALTSNGFRPRPATVRVEGILRRKGENWFLQAGPLNRFRLEADHDGRTWRPAPDGPMPGDRILVVGRMNMPSSEGERTLAVGETRRTNEDGK